METNFRRVRVSAGGLTAPDGSYRICGLLYRNEIRITRSREGAGLCFHIGNAFIYVVRHRDQLPNIAEYGSVVSSEPRHKRRPRESESRPPVDGGKEGEGERERERERETDESSRRQDGRRKEVWRRREIS